MSIKRVLEKIKIKKERMPKEPETNIIHRPEGKDQASNVPSLPEVFVNPKTATDTLELDKKFMDAVEKIIVNSEYTSLYIYEDEDILTDKLLPEVKRLLEKDIELRNFVQEHYTLDDKALKDYIYGTIKHEKEKIIHDIEELQKSSLGKEAVELIPRQRRTDPKSWPVSIPAAPEEVQKVYSVYKAAADELAKAKVAAEEARKSVEKAKGVPELGTKMFMNVQELYKLIKPLVYSAVHLGDAIIIARKEIKEAPAKTEGIAMNEALNLIKEAHPAVWDLIMSLVNDIVSTAGTTKVEEEKFEIYPGKLAPASLPTIELPVGTEPKKEAAIDPVAEMITRITNAINLMNTAADSLEMLSDESVTKEAETVSPRLSGRILSNIKLIFDYADVAERKLLKLVSCSPEEINNIIKYIRVIKDDATEILKELSSVKIAEEQIKPGEEYFLTKAIGELPEGTKIRVTRVEGHRINFQEPLGSEQKFIGWVHDWRLSKSIQKEAEVVNNVIFQKGEAYVTRPLDISDLRYNSEVKEILDNKTLEKKDKIEKIKEVALRLIEDSDIQLKEVDWDAPNISNEIIRNMIETYENEKQEEANMIDIVEEVGKESILVKDSNLNIIAKIVKRKGRWCVISEKSKRSLGCYDSKKNAVTRLRQVEFFKHKRRSK